MQHAEPATREGAMLVHRFRLERELGRGGAGEVHEALDFLGARRVALKILRADANDPDPEEGLRSEFRILRSLAHPGVVRVYDFGRTADGRPFYTMELLEGRDLASDRQGVDPHAALEQIARALDYLHASGLVHSDLKPSNVFHHQGRFTLTDFGLVRRTQGPRRETPYGTLAYMPPERLHAADTPPDPREDLYALGAILFELLTGRPPYAGTSAEATLANVLAGDLDHELAAVPEAWGRILRRLLASDPAARYASAWELMVAWSGLFDRPLPVPQVWTAPFVGRRRELANLRAAIGDLARGRGAFVHITGGPGFGKSALLDMTAAQVAASGVACWRIDTPAAANPLALVEALAHFYRRWRPGLPAETSDSTELLARWPQAVQEAPDSEDLINVHGRALDAMRRVAATAPHVIVLDDTHRLDQASQALLRFLATGARDLGILFVATARSPAGRPPDGALTLTLRELSLDDVTTLVRRRFGASQEFDVLGRRIHELTQGHPFFVSETLQHLLTTGQLRRARQGWQLQPQAEGKLLPRMADTILSEHVAAAPPGDQETYELLALFPAGASIAIVATVLERPEAEVAAALARGVRIGLLESQAGVHRFAHELIREACAERCPQASAKRHHRRIADALAGTPAEAHHRLAADERSARGRDCFLREARSYEARRAPWEALRYYAAALEIDPLAEDVDDLALHVAALRIQAGEAEQATALLHRRLPHMRAPLQRARALHLLGRAAASQGRNDEALFHLHAAAPLMHEHASADERRRFVEDLVRTLVARGDTAAAIDACSAALADIPPGEAPEARARLLLQRAPAERQTGDFATAEATCREALEVLKPRGRTLELAQTYTEFGRNYTYRSDHEQAERFYRAALKVHTELGDLNGMKNAYNNIGLALMRADRLEEAIASFQDSLELKRRLGDRPGEGNSINNLGNLWERRGEHRRAFQCYRRGVALFRRLNQPRELATLYNNMGEVHLRLGRLPRAMRLLERAQLHGTGLEGAYIVQIIAHNLGATELDLLEPLAAVRRLLAALPAVQHSRLHGLEAQYHATLARACAAAGDTARRQVHERLAEELLASGIDDEWRLGTLLDLAEAAALEGKATEITARATEAESLARSSAQPHARVCALRLLATAAQLRGEWDVAEAGLEEAAALSRAEGYRHELARCYKRLGQLHWDLGLRARAQDEFDACFQLLQDLRLRTELGLSYLERARLGD